MATLESLQAKIAKLQAQAEAIVKKDSSAVIAKIHDLMEKHGLTIADIDAHIGGGKKRGRKPGVKLAAKPSASTATYRDPKTGATWTGHGRAPAWIANAKDRSKYLVDSSLTASAPAIKKTAKPGNYVRGPQPALYADPKSGATWSGRGRAPAWIAGAKDRTKFLIAGAVEGKAEPKAVAAEKASAKKVIVKKATAKKAMSAKTSASKKAPVKKGTAKKAVPAVSKKASTKKVSMTEAAVTAPMGTVESGAGSATYA
ncbi:H-NS family nucleoid-associated regulatory protein [Paraburkholderia youngii]|uniref:DNA-binding protein H-NS n=1 Tax=Paraburkholderia youngii TaxID=2782701 RepID=A0A7W8P3R6_9BURK|nr:H-NS family nucleoid-associated regulatory protein [Paraburkholderia youngii]MBB5399092.1 DNA-binding protein H-NS [Paraburkholderia youngii]NVI08380.1 histone [Paraburkholderia youngii]